MQRAAAGPGALVRSFPVVSAINDTIHQAEPPLDRPPRLRAERRPHGRRVRRARGEGGTGASVRSRGGLLRRADGGLRPRDAGGHRGARAHPVVLRGLSPRLPRRVQRLCRRDSVAPSGHRGRRVGAARARRRPAPARARGAGGRPARLRDSRAWVRRRGGDRAREDRLLPDSLRGAAREEPQPSGSRPVLGARPLRGDGARRHDRRAVRLAADRPAPGRRSRQGVPGGDAGRRPDRRGAEPGRRAPERIPRPDGPGARHLPRPVREAPTVGGLGHAFRAGRRRHDRGRDTGRARIRAGRGRGRALSRLALRRAVRRGRPAVAADRPADGRLRGDASEHRPGRARHGARADLDAARRSRGRYS